MVAKWLADHTPIENVWNIIKKMQLVHIPYLAHVHQKNEVNFGNCKYVTFERKRATEDCYSGHDQVKNHKVLMHDIYDIYTCSICNKNVTLWC